MAEDWIEKWTRWIDVPIKGGVITMNHHRQIWRGVAEVIRGNGSLPDSAFWQYHIDIYAATQAMAVRRQGTLTTGSPASPDSSLKSRAMRSC